MQPCMQENQVAGRAVEHKSESIADDQTETASRPNEDGAGARQATMQVCAQFS